MRKTVKFENLSCKYFNTRGGISAYLNDIRRFNKPTVEEEEELFRRFKNGDELAREELIVRNQRFIFSLAKRCAKDEEEVMDYVMEGNIGLCKALEKYDPDKGFKFITYAVWYIRREMNFYLSDTKNMINKSNNLKIGKKIEKIKESEYVKNGRMPSEEELIDILKESFNTEVKNLSELYDVSMVSINENVEDDYTIEECQEFSEKTSSFNGYEDEIERESQDDEVKRYLSVLTPFEYSVVAMKFGIGEHNEMCVEDIADNFGISQMEVNKIVTNAVAKMRIYAYETVSV